MNNETRPAAYPQVGVASTCRSYEEYCAMFNLGEIGEIGGGWDAEHSSPVLDVAGGASSFTAQLHARGIQAMAVDPFYKGVTEDVIAAAAKEIEISSAKITANAEAYNWSYYGSPEQHRDLRIRSLALFAEDFRSEDAQNRYTPAELPHLPFEDQTFGLVVCSHFLFLYADTFGEQFHADSLKELLRVLKPGGELRIYPLVTLKWEQYPYLSRLIDELQGVAEVQYMPTSLPFTPITSPLLRLIKEA